MEKRGLGENFHFRFPFSTSASHSRDIEPCHFLEVQVPFIYSEKIKNYIIILSNYIL